MSSSSWLNLNKPIIGLAPMDGITDPAFREIADIYGHPDVLFTEFVPAEGILKGVTGPLHALQKHISTTPQIAQFFGSVPKAFYRAAFVALELGYDGIDINMGCPDNNIKRKGGGGALIGQPALAKDIIKTVRQAMKDWQNGKTIEEAHVAVSVIEWIKKTGVPKERRYVPVTVKTRTGLDSPITEEWFSHLIEAEPDAITLHGRTLSQMYTGKADWEQIALAKRLTAGSGIVLLGNGDVKSLTQARQYASQYDLDGILIGRASLGNPWIFGAQKPDIKEVFRVMMEHCRLYLKYRPDLKLYPMRKHLAWYCGGFEGSRALRNSLMQIVTIDDVRTLLQSVQI